MTAPDTLTTDTALEFIRDYPVALDRLWLAITDPAQLVQWFGPEGVDLHECSLDFTRTGPWHCDMVGRESGDHFIVSGQITHVRPPNNGQGSVGLTWAWHDANGQRTHESHVMFEVSETQDNRARLRLSHRDLPDMDAAQSHTKGWLSTLLCLDAFLATNPQ
ncbi:SRPBCC domain-containing protein [Rhodobacteraceae bacterium D3-12]|nr:SRPBCC domain-containing protein [Rhodobacteraceae bacterium D3-12]